MGFWRPLTHQLKKPPPPQVDQLYWNKEVNKLEGTVFLYCLETYCLQLTPNNVNSFIHINLTQVQKTDLCLCINLFCSLFSGVLKAFDPSIKTQAKDDQLYWNKEVNKLEGTVFLYCLETYCLQLTPNNVYNFIHEYKLNSSTKNRSMFVH